MENSKWGEKMGTQSTKKSVKKKNTTSRKKLLIIGVFFILIAIFVFVYVFRYHVFHQSTEGSTPSIEKDEVDFEVKHEIDRIVVESQDPKYHTNIVDIKVTALDDEDIQYVYISNVGFGIDEIRYFYQEDIINWKLSDSQDGKEYTIYITIVDSNGDVGRESVSYKVDQK